MLIGPVRVAHPFTLAPMEEHTSLPFRQQMKRFGASLVCTERVDAVDVAKRDRRAMRLLATVPGEAPRAGQISGADPVVMAEAARVIEEVGHDIIDLNFECPIRRLLTRGEGGALLADPPAIARIVAAVKHAVGIPVTLKIRSGPDGDHETAVEVAQRAEEAGASAVDVHARSVSQAYVGGPDWSVVTRVKQGVSIPVMGSGGVRQATDALRYIKDSGADGLAIGRGCLGNPWIFRDVKALWQNTGIPPAPTPAERGREALRLIEEEFHFYGTTVALRRMARTSCYFAKFIPDFKSFRDGVHKARSLEAFRRLVREHFR
jgi:nifR3 family TIM-barrel protein